MSPLSFEINQDNEEIALCQWMDIDELLNNPEISHITIQTVNVIKRGIKDGFDKVHLPAKQFQSVYKGKMFKMYHRCLDDNDN